MTPDIAVAGTKPKLVVLRGNSGSGKSTVAVTVRERLGVRAALVQQDFVRRDVLRNFETDNQLTCGLLARMTGYCLEAGCDVVLEGILDRERYGDMLESMSRSASWETHVYYFQIGFAETVRRHALRPESAYFDASEMRSWYREDDRLGLEGEQIITETSAADDTVERIMRELQSRR